MIMKVRTSLQIRVCIFFRFRVGRRGVGGGGGLKMIS